MTWKAPLTGAIAGIVLLAACDRTSPVESPAFEHEAAAAAVGKGIPLNATVDFGRDDVGSPADPASGHDASGHARDKQFPRTVLIRAGGTITFDMGSFHQVAIYAPGTLPEDIDTNDLLDLTAPGGGPVIIPQVLIDDEDQRLAIGPFSYAPMTWTAPAGTFDEPGRYLVICTFRFHFVDANMYAWVVVK